MPTVRARLLRIGGIAAAGAMVLAQAAFNASPAAAAPKPAVVHIDVTTTGGITMPDYVEAGIVTFVITSHDADYHGIQGLSVNKGSTLNAVYDDFNMGLSDDPAQRAMGAQNLLKDATLIGGGLLSPNGTVSVTVALGPGTYDWFDYADIGVITPRTHVLHAVGNFRWAALPSYSAVLVAYMNSSDEPRFISPTTLAANGTFFAYNAADELHEFMFRPTRDGITDDYLNTFYDAVVAGTPRPPTPWLGAQYGLQPISPGHWAVFHVDFTPGPYALVCYVPDDMNGLPHGYIGMHQMVNLV